MSWKAYAYTSRKLLGEYPDEPALAKFLRETCAPGTRLIVENDDASLYEAFMDEDTLKIVINPPLALQEIKDSHDDENYRFGEQ